MNLKSEGLCVQASVSVRYLFLLVLETVHQFFLLFFQLLHLLSHDVFHVQGGKVLKPKGTTQNPPLNNT